jgi:hypothetical protein
VDFTRKIRGFHEREREREREREGREEHLFGGFGAFPLLMKMIFCRQNDESQEPVSNL